MRPTVVTMPAGRDSLKYAAETPKRLLAREAAAGDQGSWDSDPGSRAPASELFITALHLTGPNHEQKGLVWVLFHFDFHCCVFQTYNSAWSSIMVHERNE